MTAEYVTTTAWAGEAGWPIYMGMAIIVLGGLVVLASFFLDDHRVFLTGAATMVAGLALCVVVSSTGDRGYDEGVLFRDLQEQTGILLLHELGDNNGFLGDLDGEMIEFSMRHVEGDTYLLVREGSANETTTGKG